jgi:hypothetical protein
MIANVFEIIATSKISSDVIIRIAVVTEHPANDLLLGLCQFHRHTFSPRRHSAKTSAR